MRNAVVVMGVLVVCLLPQIAHSEAVPISESSYVRIYNFTGLYTNYPWYDPNTDTWSTTYQWNGFDPYPSYYSSVPTIEAKPVNVKNPGLPPNTRQLADNGLMFDCHAGSANLGDCAIGSPEMFVGDEPWYHAEFDWDANVNSEAAPYFCLRLTGSASPSGQQKILYGRFDPGPDLPAVMWWPISPTT